MTRVRLGCQLAPALVDDPDGQAELRAFLASIRPALAAMVATNARGERVAQASAALAVAAEGAVRNAVEARLEEELPLNERIGIGCALSELSTVEDAMLIANLALEASHAGFAAVLGVVSG